MNNPPEVKQTNRLKAAGILLLLFGIGLPIITVIVTVLFIAISNDSLSRLIILVTGWVIVIPLWVLPIIGGAFVLKRKHYAFVLTSCMVSLLYWIPYLILVIGSRRYMFSDETATFWLYLPVLILPIPAVINVVRGKREFIKGSPSR